MDLQLRGKRALISGSTAGIGFAIASALAREGASVIINGRTQQRVDAALSKLRHSTTTGKVEGIAADLGTAAGIKAVVDRFPEVDILINNLSIFDPKAFEDIPDEEWLKFFEVNVLSGVRLSRHYLPPMKKLNWGRVIFISSESAIQIPAEMIHYGMTKTAELAIARGLAETTVGTNVTVNSILPGPTSSEGVTEFVTSFAAKQGVSREKFESEFFKTARPTSLLQRFTTPEEVAEMVAFIASPLSSATNGAAVRVDGGVIRAIGS